MEKFITDIASKVNNMKGWSFMLMVYLMWFVFKFAISLQGFDLCDEGWVMTGYQQIFNDPGSIEYLFLYYNAQLVGGLWNWLLCGPGYLGFRVLCIISDLLCIWILYLLLRKIVKKSIFLIGVFATMLLDCFGFVFHHNHLTFLLVTLSLFFIINGVFKNKKSYVFIAGVVIGVNTFSRLPNLSMMGLGLLFLLDLYYKKEWKVFWQNTLCALAGLACGIAVELLVMKVFGHDDVFLKAINEMQNAASGTDSNHNLSRMLSVYIGNYLQILKWTVVLFAYGVAHLYLSKRFTDRKLQCFQVLNYMAYFVILLKFGGIGNVYLLYALSTIVLVSVFVVGDGQLLYKYLSLSALVVLYFLPIGSDFGIGNMGTSCLFPVITIVCLLMYDVITRVKNANHRASIIMTAVLVFTFYVPTQLYKTYQTCYFDSGSRFKKTHLIDNELATTFTSKEKTLAINELLHELSKYVQEDDYLFCFQNLSTIHFLTKTRPYLYNPWVWTYDSDTFENQLARAKKEKEQIPVVVREKVVLPGSDWLITDKDFDNENVKDNYKVKKRRIIGMNKFLKENNYHVQWENAQFQILLPNS